MYTRFINLYFNNEIIEMLTHNCVGNHEVIIAQNGHHQQQCIVNNGDEENGMNLCFCWWNSNNFTLKVLQYSPFYAVHTVLQSNPRVKL
jgi:hypothetical protein